jgi:anti-anti-sigma factor
VDRLTRHGLDRLTAYFTARIGDPRGDSCGGPALGTQGLRRRVARAILGIEGYLDLAEQTPPPPGLAAARAQAEELWTVLEESAAWLEATGSASAPVVVPQHVPNGGAACSSGGGPGDTFTKRRIGTVLLLTVTGALDVDTADAVRCEPIDLAGASRMVIDLSGLEFCDSTGLNALLRLRIAAAGQGIPVHLSGLSGRVHRLLELTGSAEVFATHASVEEAMAVAE